MISNPISLVHLREHLLWSWRTNRSRELWPPDSTPDASKDGHQALSPASQVVFSGMQVINSFFLVIQTVRWCRNRQSRFLPFGRKQSSASKGNKINIPEKHKESEESRSQKWKELVLVRVEFLGPDTLLMVGYWILLSPNTPMPFHWVLSLSKVMWNFCHCKDADWNIAIATRVKHSFLMTNCWQDNSAYSFWLLYNLPTYWRSQSHACKLISISFSWFGIIFSSQNFRFCIHLFMYLKDILIFSLNSFLFEHFKFGTLSTH